MTPVRYIVDGYNLIRRTPALLELERRALEAGREALLDRLFLYKAGKNIEITVVFDGPGGSGFWARGGIRAEFARPADAAIIELAGPGTVVVSSDNEVQEGARRRGARTLPSEEFWGQVVRAIERRRYRRPAEGRRAAFQGTWDKAYDEFEDDEDGHMPKGRKRRKR
ncbi:MAG: uncharacterized protein PWQ41_1219 [Bacillota bacterium]|nr:uncharacterized protein [Bacillota bacterium]MDK2925445.1 uncharacterized protein [Bacillota bacterium]MDK2960373.1 uncharacterized protein [Bacillota bacterium]